MKDLVTLRRDRDGSLITQARLAQLLLTLLLASLSTPGHATFISASDFGAHFRIHSSPASISSYDHALGLYTMNAAIAPARLEDYPLGGTSHVSDLMGSFSLTAAVDSTGLFTSGSYALIGGSVSLGIAAGTTLISGTLSSVNHVRQAGVNTGFQSIGTIDVMDATLTALAGFADQILIYDFQPATATWSAAPWTTSFNRVPSYTGPDFFGASTAIAEPPTALLLAIGALTWFRRRRRQIVSRAP